MCGTVDGFEADLLAARRISSGVRIKARHKFSLSALDKGRYKVDIGSAVYRKIYIIGSSFGDKTFARRFQDLRLRYHTVARLFFFNTFARIRLRDPFPGKYRCIAIEQTTMSTTSFGQMKYILSVVSCSPIVEVGSGI